MALRKCCTFTTCQCFRPIPPQSPQPSAPRSYPLFPVRRRTLRNFSFRRCSIGKTSMPNASIGPHGKINDTVYRITALAFFIVITAAGEGCANHAQHQKNLFSIRYDRTMPRDRIALIIPGMHQSNQDPGYDSVGGYYTSMGI